MADLFHYDALRRGQCDQRHIPQNGFVWCQTGRTVDYGIVSIYVDIYDQNLAVNTIPQLRGFNGAYHSAAPCSNPKHTINAFINLYCLNYDQK